MRPHATRYLTETQSERLKIKKKLLKTYATRNKPRKVTGTKEFKNRALHLSIYYAPLKLLASAL